MGEKYDFPEGIDAAFDFAGEAPFVGFVKDISTPHGRFLALSACFKGSQAASNFTDAVMLGLDVEAKVAWKAAHDADFHARVKALGATWWRSLDSDARKAAAVEAAKVKAASEARKAAKAAKAASDARVGGEVDKHNLGDEIDRIRHADAPKADKPAEPKTPEEWRELKKQALAEGREWESGIQPDFEEVAEILADEAMKHYPDFKKVWAVAAHGTPVWEVEEINDLFGPVGLKKWKADKADHGEASKNDKCVRMARFRINRALADKRAEEAAQYERELQELIEDAM